MTPDAVPLLLHHRVDGPGSAPPPLLGTSLDVWGPHPRCRPGPPRPALGPARHGGSPAELMPDTSPGVTTVADLGRLVLDLAHALGIEHFPYAGILGGAVGAWLAVHHPGRVTSLALMCSSAHVGAAGPWEERAALLRLK